MGCYATSTGVTLEVEPALSEHARSVNPQAGPERVMALATTGTTATAVCTHRPVLPGLQAALGIREPVHLQPADVLVVHLAGGVPVAVEHHAAADRG
jgi:uncharacterized ParB-like nuclease family protein